MHSILQVVDAFYASLQIHCAAHNSQIAGFTEYKKQYHKDPTFSFVVYYYIHKLRAVFFDCLCAVFSQR